PTTASRKPGSGAAPTWSTSIRGLIDCSAWIARSSADPAAALARPWPPAVAAPGDTSPAGASPGDWAQAVRLAAHRRRGSKDFIRGLDSTVPPGVRRLAGHSRTRPGAD